MKKIAKFLPLYTIAAGVIGCVARLLLFTAVDDRGLLPANHFSSGVLWVLLLLTAALMGLYVLLRPKGDFRFLVGKPVQALGYLAGGLGCLGMLLFSNTAGQAPVIWFLLTVCFAGMGIFRLLGRKPPLALPAALSLLSMILVFLQYRHFGSQTQLHSYLFPALAFLFMALYSLQLVLLDVPQYNFKTTFFCQQIALFSSLVCLSTQQWPFFLAISLWLLSGLFVTPYRMRLPKEVLGCIRKLEKAGYSAYAVGGCVRDSLLGITPHDYDLCTNATPEQMMLVFAGSTLVTSGEKHGTIGVVQGKQVYEITTFRTEGQYADNRHPEWVEFVDDVQTDLARRDFTINAMAYHPKTGYLDPFGGQKDLYDGVLKAVGDPEQRFQEDSLRILRGVRFACRFRLRIDPKTKKAMDKLSGLMDNLARERVLSELTQILCHMQETDLLRYQAVMLQVLPELESCVRFKQHSPHHKYDVLTHTAHTLAAVEAQPALRWAALLHDIGKPQVFTRDEQGVGHFPDHAKAGAEIAEDILNRLKASNELKQQVLFLITHHCDPIAGDKAALTKKISKYGADNLKALILLQAADRLAKGKKQAYPHDPQQLAKTIDQIQASASCLQLKDLAVNGHDLMQIGFPAGPELGQCQKQLFEMVLDGILPNEKDALLQKAQQILAKNQENEETL